MILLTNSKYYGRYISGLNFRSFSRSLQALQYIIDTSIPPRSKHILMPDYLCPDVFYLFEQNNFKISLYTLDSNLRPVIDNLQLSSYDVVYFVDYFGLEEGASWLEQYPRTNSTLLIYDCAQRIPSSYPKSHDGIIEFYSIHKVYRNLNYSILSGDISENQCDFIKSDTYKKQFILEKLYFLVPFVLFIRSILSIYYPKFYRRESTSTKLPIEANVRSMFPDLHHAIQRRRYIYLSLYNLFNEVSCIRVYELKELSAPIYFPLYIDGAFKQFYLQMLFSLFGVQMRRCWDSYYFEMNCKYKNIFLLPLTNIKLVHYTKFLARFING